MDISLEALIILAAITGASGLIGLYAMLKLAMNLAKKELKNELAILFNDEKFQKALFELGGIIGNGAKAGFGLQKQGGQKGLWGFLGSLAAQYLGNKVGLPQASNTPIEQ